MNYIENLFGSAINLVQQSVNKVLTTPILILAIVVGFIFQMFDIRIKVN